jgi:hypothetical protein
MISWKKMQNKLIDEKMNELAECKLLIADLLAAGNAMAEVMGDAKTIFGDASCYCPYCSGVEHVDDCEFIAALAAWEQVTK